MKIFLTTFLLILSIFVLLLLCIATIICIIKLLNPQRNHKFNLRHDSRLYNLAYKDDLTGLFNRNAYIRDLADLQKKKTKTLWFSIFDIDNFKTVNDTKGHLYGDEILILAAKRLLVVFGEKNHTVYRIGGDEFLVISENISENDLIKLMLDLKHLELKNNEFEFSKGYSSVAYKSSEHFNFAFNNADQMLYAEKRSKTRKTPALASLRDEESVL